MQASHQNRLPPEERLPPVTDLRAEKGRQQLWLWLGIGAIVFLIAVFVTAVVLNARKPAPAESQVAVLPPASRTQPAATPSPPAPAVGTETAEEAPRVTVRSLPIPPGLNAPQTHAPLANAPLMPGAARSSNAPLGQPTLPGSALPGSPFGGPAQGMEPTVVPPLPSPETPAEPARPITPPVDRPAAEAVPRRRQEPVVQAEKTGGLRLYFDADSSTFDRRERRLPLRVEVYVDGKRLLETDDPEKQEFRLGRLPAGEHELRIVPYVGDAAPDARTEVVTIQPGEVSRFKAVLRRSDGVARISKFRSRD